jgi:hypothetical protein
MEAFVPINGWRFTRRKKCPSCECRVNAAPSGVRDSARVRKGFSLEKVYGLELRRANARCQAPVLRKSNACRTDADGIAQWTRTVGRTIAGTPDKSPFFRSTKGRSMSVKLDRKVRYELDGGDRTKIKSYDLEVEPRAVTICVPAGNNGSADA